MSDEAKRCHLTFLQAIVARMASNSFLLKGWSVTLIVAIFTLAAKDSEARLIFLSYLSAVLFWGLDTYYLWQERLFRKLYDEVANDRIGSSTFSLDTTPVKGHVPSLPATFAAGNLIAFHLPVIFLISLASAVVFK